MDTNLSMGLQRNGIMRNSEPSGSEGRDSTRMVTKARISHVMGFASLWFILNFPSVFALIMVMLDFHVYECV